MIDSDAFRTLASSPVERTDLDFKRTHYDKNQELAKDVMAMANALAPGSAPAHILIGLDESKAFPDNMVGVPPDSHHDDAKQQEKVKAWLNRVPSFSYHALEVEGRSFGVFEIRPGGRPFYPVRESSPSLQRYVAQVRSGSSTIVPSPDDIINWWKQDDPDEVERRLLATESLREEVEIRARIYPHGTTRSGGGGYVEQRWQVQNDGRRTFDIARVAIELRPNEAFRENYRRAVRNDIAPDVQFSDQIQLGPHASTLRQGDKCDLAYRLDAERIAALLRKAGLQALETFNTDWFRAKIAVQLRAGDRATELVAEADL